jgi:release factor glutamine methyltransferase
MLSIAAARRAAITALAAHVDVDEARVDADELLRHVLGKDGAWVFAHGDEALAPDAVERLAALVAARAAGRPVAYLTGRRGFWRFDLEVTPDTLIPRADTECLVEQALARLPVDRTLRLLDLGTGTGAIALAIASERPLADVTATDASAGALAVAAGNARDAGLPVRFLPGDWFAAVPREQFDLVLSNPPYIADDDPHLQQGDLRFEPRTALASGADGLDAIRAICAGTPAHLAPGGWLLVEHGFEQGAAVRDLFRAAGLEQVATERDLEHRDRVTLGRRPRDAG